MHTFGRKTAVNIPFTAVIWGRQKGAANAGKLRLLFFIKSQLTNSRGEFFYNQSAIGRETGYTRQSVAKAVGELMQLGVIVGNDSTGKLRIVSNQRISQIFLNEIGGIDSYRTKASKNKVCKLPIEYLQNQDKAGFRMVLDCALLLEEEHSQKKAIQFRKSRTSPKKHNIRKQESQNDLLFSDGDSSAPVPVLSCEGQAKRQKVDKSTACRRLSKLQSAGIIDRKNREIVISASTPGYPPPEVMKALRKGYANCYFSRKRQAYIRPLASSLSVIDSLGIEWVRRNF